MQTGLGRKNWRGGLLIKESW